LGHGGHAQERGALLGPLEVPRWLPERDGHRFLLALPFHEDVDLIARRVLADHAGEFIGGCDGAPTDLADDIVDLDFPRCRRVVQDVDDGGFQRLVEVVHRRGGGVRLRGGEGRLVLLLDFLGRLIRGEDLADRHEGVVGGQPPGERLAQGEFGVHGDGSHIEVSGGLTGLRTGDLDDLLAALLAEGVEGRALALRGAGNRQVDIGARDARQAKQGHQDDDRGGAQRDRSVATEPEFHRSYSTCSLGSCCYGEAEERLRGGVLNMEGRRIGGDGSVRSQHTEWADFGGSLSAAISKVVGMSNFGFGMHPNNNGGNGDDNGRDDDDHKDGHNGGDGRDGQGDGRGNNPFEFIFGGPGGSGGSGQSNPFGGGFGGGSLGDLLNQFGSMFSGFGADLNSTGADDAVNY